MALNPFIAWAGQALRTAWLPLLFLVFVAWVANAVFQTGRRYGGHEAQQAVLQAQLATEREHAARLAALGRALAEVELRASDAVQRTEHAEHTLRQEIARYAQRPRLAGDSRPCLDADGLRLWRAANAAAHPDTEAAGLDAGGGPATAAAQRRGGRDPAAKPRGGHHGLPPPARPSQRAGGVDQGAAP